MNTTDLFNFRFVDRDNERKKFKKFFKNSEENVLWVKGKRGFGKTTFINFMLEEYPQYALCYLDIPKQSDSLNIIIDLISQLQKQCGINFIEETQNKYKEFYNKTYKSAQKITSTLFPQISNIIEIIMDTAYYAVTKSDEKKESIDIIYHYITTILNSKKLCICIDNLSRCNSDTIDFFFKIIKVFLSNQNFRACIITTSEDLSSDSKSEIFRYLPFTDIEITRLKKYTYFYEILDPIFDLNNFEKEDFEYIFIKCEGSPKKLSTIISKLLEKQGITLHKQSKATINKSILFSILQAESIKFKDSDFTAPQKWIVFSFICIGEKISIEYLKDLALYISSKFFLYYTYDIAVFRKELLNLIENRILEYADDSNMIDTFHDEDYLELTEIFNESPMFGMFTHRTFEFFLLHPEYPNYEKIVCKNAMRANVPEWEKMNFRYGKKLFKQKQYQDAQQVFNRISSSFHKLHSIQILLIGINSYETGNYNLAIKQLNILKPESFRFVCLKFYHSYYLAKSYNNIGNVTQAVEILECILHILPEISQQYLKVLNLLHMYYLEIPGKEKDAKNIFNNIRENYRESFPEIWANTMRGCQNFKSGKEALMILDQAEELLSDELEKAFLENTRGFVLIKSNELSAGEECFRNAAKTISQLKNHEYAYAANNQAVCRMLVKDYSTARSILLEALFWNKTVYGELVIQTHLMICSVYLGYSDDVLYYYNILQKYLEDYHPSDYTINRKIFMNLAIVDRINENHIMEAAHLRKADKYVKNTASEWRYNKLAGIVSEESFSNDLYHTLNFEPWFLIYAHD